MPALKPEKVRYLVVHCSASPPKVKVDRTVIDRWHRERGFLGIGYHYVICRDGTVQVGRAMDQIGAHVVEHNHESIGICLAGGVDEKQKPEDNFTPEQKTALRKLLGSLLILFRGAEIVGHRDLNPHKDCPSFDVKSWWQSEMIDGGVA